MISNGIRFDFTMCNPPFFSSAEDVAQSAESKELSQVRQVLPFHIFLKHGRNVFYAYRFAQAQTSKY
jgi:23S rRNA A1618 N6-methylase RlmF